MAHGVEYGKAAYWDDRYKKYVCRVLPTFAHLLSSIFVSVSDGDDPFDWYQPWSVLQPHLQVSVSSGLLIFGVSLLKDYVSSASGPSKRSHPRCRLRQCS
jgi:hypothetical protein